MLSRGFFIATGKALSDAGPASMLLAYFMVCIGIWANLQTLTELNIAFPTSANYIDYAGRWVDPALAFGARFAEWLGWTSVFAAEATFSVVLINYWARDAVPEAALHFCSSLSLSSRWLLSAVLDRLVKLCNACLNPICAITGIDTGTIRLADDAVETLVRPAMDEIIGAAKACGVNLPDGVSERMSNIDPLTMYLRPSMVEDVSKGNLIEFENIVGAPLARLAES
ncbi:putative histidine permease [Talaromyces pinophilus]|nr:putative histidine permease [Talaromyces pinophilus]